MNASTIDDTATTDPTAPDLASKPAGYAVTRFNAVQHGMLSRYTVLPWEDAAEYAQLFNAVVAEHAPQGPTEAHLVEELAGIIWRKRRLRLAEAAAHQRGLGRTTDPYGTTASAALVHIAVPASGSVADAIRTKPADLAELDAVEALITRALGRLDAGGPTTYAEALACLADGTRDWWHETLADEVDDEDDSDDQPEPVPPDAAGLRRFLTRTVLPAYTLRRRQLAQAPLLRAQAFGEALEPDKMTRLARYQTHLDRKLERTLVLRKAG